MTVPLTTSIGHSKEVTMETAISSLLHSLILLPFIFQKLLNTFMDIAWAMIIVEKMTLILNADQSSLEEKNVFVWCREDWSGKRHILGHIFEKASPSSNQLENLPQPSPAIFIVVVVQSLSRVQFFATPWAAARQAFLSFTISQSLLKLMSIESMMPSNYLVLCHPLLLLPSIFPSIRVFSNELALLIRWPKYWSFSFIINPSNEYSGLISFRI